MSLKGLALLLGIRDIIELYSQEDNFFILPLEAVILCVAVGVIGLLGLGASYILFKFFISEVTPWSILLAFIFSVVIGITFGMTSVIRASKLSTIEALRYR